MVLFQALRQSTSSDVLRIFLEGEDVKENIIHDTH